MKFSKCGLKKTKHFWSNFYFWQEFLTIDFKRYFKRSVIHVASVRGYLGCRLPYKAGKSFFSRLLMMLLIVIVIDLVCGVVGGRVSKGGQLDSVRCCMWKTKVHCLINQQPIFTISWVLKLKRLFIVSLLFVFNEFEAQVP